MLKKIFGSGARVKLFKQFLNNQDQEFFIRELTRILEEQINSLRRELENLEQIGLLKSKEKNRKKYYSINTHFILLPELTSIIKKTDEFNDDFLKKIAKVPGNSDLIILSGKFINSDLENSEIDLFVVGNIKKQDLQSFLDENFANNNFKYSLMTREDFLYRITLKDKFVKNIFTTKDNIIIKNKLKKDTEGLILA